MVLCYMSVLNANKEIANERFLNNWCVRKPGPK